MIVVKKIILFFLATILLMGSSSFEAPETSDAEEYNLKAVFLYSFINYVEWGDAEARGVFNIGILGNSGIVPPMMELANNKMVKNNRIIVRQYNDVSDIRTCQILFVSKNNTVPLETIISRIGDKPILVITEQKGSCEKGSHINFFIAQDKLKFEVNLRTASRSGLRISSQLLQHATEIVR